MTNPIVQDFTSTRYVAYGPAGWAPYRPQNLESFSIAEDLKCLREIWDGLITYGCTGVLETIPEIAADLGFKSVIIGVYNIADDAEVQRAMELIARFPSMIKAVCLGNEGLCFKNYSMEQLLECIDRFGARFPKLWITTSEPIFAWGDQRLFAKLDFALPIIHPWIHEIFKSDPEMAAMWTIQAAQRLQLFTKLPVLIKETGFPCDGKLYPSAHQEKFWDVLLSEIGALTRDVGVAFFEAFDNPEKQHYSACAHWDCFWGLFDEQRRAKPVVRIIRRHFGLDRLPNVEVAPESRDVSVVIASKDRPELLKEAIESVWSQRSAIGELILVNDNSRDLRVREICLDYAQAPNVTYVERSTPGSSGTARNAGLECVTKPFVCFLDDDDLFGPEKIARQLNFFAAHPDCAAVATGAMVIDETGVSAGRSGSPDFFPGAPLANMMAFCRVIHSSVMMRSALVRELNGYREHFQGEDWDLWIRMLRKGWFFHFMSEPLVRYRRHSSNISNSSYLKAAVNNILSSHSDLTSRELLSPLNYDPASGELVKAAIYLVHGKYDAALEFLRDLDLPAARVARFICQRELAAYSEAEGAIAEWADRCGLKDELRERLRVHRNKFSERRRNIMVGSPALLFEHRLMAQDALKTAAFGEREILLDRYFYQNPKNIFIEREGFDGEELLFSRVSLTSC